MWLGSYTELYQGGQAWIGGPAVVLHPPSEPNANRIDEGGLEAIGIQLELDWLRWAGFDLRLDGTRCWIGGRVAAAAKWLAMVWTRALRSAERRLFYEMGSARPKAYAQRKTISFAPDQRIERPIAANWSSFSVIIRNGFPASCPTLLPNRTVPYAISTSVSLRPPG
jgi:hypothetical protein